MNAVFNYAAATCGFAASWFWYSSAKTFVPDPPVGAFAEQAMPALASYREAVRIAARENRWAALLSGASALLAGLGLIWPGS